MTPKELKDKYCKEFGYSYFNKYNENDYTKWLEKKLNELTTKADTSKANLTIPVVSESMLNKEQLEKLMWKYATEVEDTDNIIGLHICDNFRKWLANEIMKNYYS